MSNEKLSEITSEVTAPAETDRLYLASNISTTPVHNFIETGNLLGTARIAAEVTAGIVPTDIRKDPGNVLRYGTNTTPGTTDMTTAIQAALTTIGSMATGGTVLFPPGTYETSSALLIYNDTYIEGYGAKIIHGSSNGFNNAGFAAETANSNIRIAGLTLDGDGTFNGSIATKNVTRMLLQDLHISNYNNGVNNGISVNATTGLTAGDIMIRNCVIDTPDYGINVTGNTDDPILFSVELNDEYDNVATELNFTQAEINHLFRNNLKATFMPEKEKQARLKALEEHLQE